MSRFRRDVLLARLLVDWVAELVAWEVGWWVPQAVDADGEEHGHGFEDVEEPFVRECVAFDAHGEFDESVDRTDLYRFVSGVRHESNGELLTQIRVLEMQMALNALSACGGAFGAALAVGLPKYALSEKRQHMNRNTQIVTS